MVTIAELQQQLNRLVQLLDEVWCANVFDVDAACTVSADLRGTLARLKELTAKQEGNAQDSVSRLPSPVSNELSEPRSMIEYQARSVNR